MAKHRKRSRARKSETLKRRAAAGKAWKKMRSPTWLAKRSARRSQTALSEWARKHGWRVVFLDAKSGNPRTGIVDVVLLRIAPRSPDVVQVRLVQLKGGHAGLTASEARRLDAAATKVEVKVLHALHDGSALSLAEPVHGLIAQ